MNIEQKRNRVADAFEKISDKIFAIDGFEYRVIVLCSILDSHLQDMLDGILRKPINNDQNIKLSLSEKITLSYQLGFFEEDVCIVYNQLRKMRNNFAHQISHCGPSIKDHKNNVLHVDSPIPDFFIDIWSRDIIPAMDEYNIVLDSKDQDSFKFLYICIFYICGLKWI